MGTSIEQLMVTADHVVPVEPLGGTATVLVNSGDVVYYNDNRVVDATHNIASIAKGTSASVTVPTWLKSAGLSSVTVTTTDPVSGTTTTTTTVVAATAVQRVPYSADSPFNQSVLNAPVDATSSAVISAISANQINAGQPSGLMSTSLDPSTQFALPLFDATKAVAKGTTGETGLLAVYVSGVFSQVLSRTAPLTRTNSYSQEISVPGNWGDLCSDGAGDNNTVVANWATGESYDLHGLASSVTKLLSASPQMQIIGNASISGTSGVITVPAGGVPSGVLTFLAFSSMQGQTITSIADSRSGAWTKQSPTGDGSAQGQTAQLWTRDPNATALLAADTITVTCPSSHGFVEAFWMSNTNGYSLDGVVESFNSTPTVTTTDSGLVLYVEAVNTQPVTLSAPWTTDDTLHEAVANSWLQVGHQIQTAAGAVSSPRAGTTSSPFRTVIVAGIKLSAAVKAGSYPAGATLISTNSPVWPANADKLRVGTPGGSNWETVTVSGTSAAVGSPLTVSATANTHLSGDLVIDCWTTTSLASPGVTSIVVPLAGTYLNSGPQHIILDLGDTNQETVLISAVVGTTVTISATTKTHGANCSIAAITGSNVSYWGPGALNWDGVPPRTSTANSQLGNSGSGVSYLAGIVTAWDLQQGVINHAVGIDLMDGAPNINTDGTFNTGGASPGPYFVFPATYSDQNAPRAVSGAGWTSGTASGTSLLTTSPAGNSVSLVAGEKVIVGYGTANAETLTIQTVVDGTHLTFTGSLGKTHATGEYVAPAGAVPMGARLRLKQSWQPPSGKSAAFYMIVDALKRYGVVFRDGGGHSKATFESQITAQFGSGSTPALVPADLGLIPLASLELVVLPS